MLEYPYMSEQKAFPTINDLGFEAYAQKANLDLGAYPPERIARVTEEYRTRWILSGQGEPLDASVRGALHYDLDTEAFPKVGDWVFFTDLGKGKAIIEELLPRVTVVTRKNISGPGKQVLVANVDIVAIVQAVDQDFSIPKLERYLTLVRESGAKPLVVFTKADVGTDIAPFVQALAGVDPTAASISVSSRTENGLDSFLAVLKPQTTVVLLGSSGAGKSTLLNALMKSEIQDTQEVRAEDGKGRHTTTMRSLFVLPSGALMIDTPGMRELTAATDEEEKIDTFDDVAEIAYECKFPNCDHVKSSGCAVLVALKDGRITEERYQKFLKFLEKEKKNEVKKVGNTHSDRVKSNRAALNYESRMQSEEEDQP